MQLPPTVAKHLLENAGRIAAALALIAPFLKKVKLPGPIAALAAGLAALLSKEAIDKVLDGGRAKLEEAKAEALARHNYLTAVLTRFRIDLEDAEHARVLLRSRK